LTSGGGHQHLEPASEFRGHHTEFGDVASRIAVATSIGGGAATTKLYTRDNSGAFAEFVLGAGGVPASALDYITPDPVLQIRYACVLEHGERDRRHI
jgi:hypothetical protein